MRKTGLVGAWSYSALLLAVACTSTPPTAPPDSGPPVSSCATSCATGLTCTRNSDFPDGACTASCVTAGGGGCPAGDVCAPLSTGNYCVQTCTISADCHDGLTCASTSEGKVCLARGLALGTPTSCPAPQLLVGATAGPATDPGTCQTPRVPSALPAADVQSLGIHPVGSQLSFNVTAGAVGLSVVSQGVSVASPFIVFQGIVLANLPVPSPLDTPSGGTFFDDNASLPADVTSALFLVASPAPLTAALTFPGTSAALNVALDGGLPGGTWTLGVNDYAFECLSLQDCDGGTASNTYDLSVLVKPGPLAPTGQMAVDVYLVSTKLDAGVAVSTAAVQRFAKQYATFYAQAGVCVSTVTFHDVPAWAQAKYASLSVDDAEVPCGEFRQMFTLAAPGRTMELFLVDELVTTQTPGGVGQSIVGLDGAIPGPATFNGTIAGGAAVSGADLLSTGGCGTGFSASCGPDEVAYVAAHETGHFLGLYHPSENGGDFFDPLVDTAACVCQLCLSAPGSAACGGNPDGGSPAQVLPENCSGTSQECGGANLLMFWVITSSSVGNVTPEQSAVVRANPLIAP